jgi:hypothetical protein
LVFINYIAFNSPGFQAGVLKPHQTRALAQILIICFLLLFILAKAKFADVQLFPDMNVGAILNKQIVYSYNSNN